MVHHDAMKKSAAPLFRFAVPALLCVLLSSCSAPGSGGGSAPAKNRTNTKVEQPGEFPDNSTMKAIQQRGKLLVGLPVDLPPFAYEDQSTGSLQGFDIEIARLIASGIFGAEIEGKVDFIPLDARDRELALSQNKVDIAMGRYPITVSGKRFIDYAGPYFMAYQTIVTDRSAGSRNDRIESITQLNNRKICTVRGSTKSDAILKSIPQADVSTQMSSVAECSSLLASKAVAAIAAEHIDMLEITGKSANSTLTPLTKSMTVGVEPYGIGINKQEIDFRQYVNNRLETIEGDSRWQEALKKSIPNSDDKAPPVERY